VEELKDREVINPTFGSVVHHSTCGRHHEPLRCASTLMQPACQLTDASFVKFAMSTLILTPLVELQMANLREEQQHGEC